MPLRASTTKWRNVAQKSLTRVGTAAICYSSCPVAAFAADPEVQKWNEVCVRFLSLANRRCDDSKRPIKHVARPSPFVTRIIRSPTTAAISSLSSERAAPFVTGRIPSRSGLFMDTAKNSKNASWDDLGTESGEIKWEAVLSKIKELITSNNVVLFMKGSPGNPKCGFSAQVVNILRQLGVVNYTFVDVLEHVVIREGVKKFTNWPTLPQLYVNGEFVGGCDVVTHLHQNHQLIDLFKEGDFEDRKNS